MDLYRDTMQSERKMLTGTSDLQGQIDWFAKRGIAVHERKFNRDPRGRTFDYTLWLSELTPAMLSVLSLDRAQKAA